MGKGKRIIISILLVFLLALIIEAINLWVIKWWMFSSNLTLGKTLLLWIVLGSIIGILNAFEKEKLVGLFFASWGILIETINLYFLNFWNFTSDLTMIGTYLVWVLMGLSLYIIQKFYSIEKIFQIL